MTQELIVDSADLRTPPAALRRLSGRAPAPRGPEVVLEAEHTCMTLRGVRAPGSTTVTSALLGTVRAVARTRAEFFARPGGPG